MHKKQPRYLISTIAMLLWMKAGSAKIRDGAAGIYSGPLFSMTNWIYRNVARRQFSVGDKSPSHSFSFDDCREAKPSGTN
jgi:hypothetical protein